MFDWRWGTQRRNGKKIDELGIKKQVAYLGRREDIQQFYNAMDCFLLPSLYEGLPVVGLEAESCGLPMFFQLRLPERQMHANWDTLLD